MPNNKEMIFFIGTSGASGVRAADVAVHLEQVRTSDLRVCVASIVGREYILRVTHSAVRGVDLGPEAHAGIQTRGVADDCRSPPGKDSYTGVFVRGIANDRRAIIRENPVIAVPAGVVSLYDALRTYSDTCFTVL